MRLSSDQLRCITDNIHDYFGHDALIWLFGSRIKDEKRGGDVDLYVEAVPQPLMQELRCKIRLEEALDIPVDLVVRPPKSTDPISKIAKTEGVPL